MTRPPTLDRATTLARVREAGILAVLRAPSADAAITAADALIAGGIIAIEVTFSTPGATEAIRALRERHGDVALVGAGTVVNAVHATDAAVAGAQFLVSPGTDPQLVHAMRETGLVTMTGALTPSEVMAALAAQVDVVKVFPASLGGPGYLRALRGPFPDAPLMPTGGVSADNLAEWFAAGALAVGAGGDLCPADALTTGDWPRLTELARRFTDALRVTRAAEVAA